MCGLPQGRGSGKGCLWRTEMVRGLVNTMEKQKIDAMVAQLGPLSFVDE